MNYDNYWYNVPGGTGEAVASTSSVCNLNNPGGKLNTDMSDAHYRYIRCTLQIYKMYITDI
jgi:hypothetical protein